MNEVEEYFEIDTPGLSFLSVIFPLGLIAIHERKVPSKSCNPL